MRRRIVFAILVVGFSGLVMQILLLRELLVTFYGNELSIGIILANWLILEAFGCFFFSKKAEGLKRPIQGFITLQIISSISLPIAIYLTRSLKGFIGVMVGEGLDLISMFYSSFVILLFVSIPHGALFTLSCKIYSLYSKEDATSIGKVYIYETLGTIMGGLLFTYLLLPYLHSFQIAFGLSLLNITLCIYLLGPLWQKEKILLNKALGSLLVALLTVYSYLLFSPDGERIHHFSISQQWKDQRLVHYQNSIYGNIAVIERGGEYTFFYNSLPIITTPTPDIVYIEEFVHLPMLSHPKPEDVLIISGGAGGVINEILKHPSIKRIDYVELDPLLLEVIRRFPTPLTEAELDDPRVNMEYIDGRLFIKRTSHKYDLVFAGPSIPLDLQVNRFFTKEFFSLVKERLKEGGILVTTLPGSLTYLSKELKDLNACIINTLKDIYPHVRIIPGDGRNLYLSSTSQAISMVEDEQLSKRLQDRGLNVSLLTPEYIEYRMHPRWLEWFLSSLEGATSKINQDFQPLGLFFGLSYWNALFSPYMQLAFRWFEKINLWLFFILFSIISLFFLLIRLKIKRLYKMSIPLCITTTGFSGMIFDLALIFTFQVLYGYVFHWVGFLVTTFMVGITIGGLCMTSLLGRIKEEFGSFLKLEVAIIIFSCILPIVFLIFHPYLARPVVFSLLKALLLLLCFISGALVGAQFPLANKIYLAIRPQGFNLSRTAGLLYGVDLLGGWIGGIIGSVVLLPVLGFFGTCIVVLMLKVSSFIIMATSIGRLRLST